MTLRFRLASSLFLVLGLGSLTACPPKAVVETASGAQEADESESSNTDVALEGSDITHEDLQTLVSNFERVHFDYDMSELDSKSREVLAANAEILLAHPELKVKVEGHADHWGSDIYNLALGQKRAESVKAYLLNLGVLGEQLEVISFGEERPLTASQGDRAAEAPNRRAEFFVSVKKDGLNVGSSY